MEKPPAIEFDRGAIVQIGAFARWDSCATFFAGSDRFIAVSSELGVPEIVHAPEGPMLLANREFEGISLVAQPSTLVVRADRSRGKAWLSKRADEALHEMREAFGASPITSIAANAVWAAPVRSVSRAAAALEARCGTSLSWTELAGGEPASFWRSESRRQGSWHVNVAFGPAARDSRAVADALRDGVADEVIAGLHLDDSETFERLEPETEFADDASGATDRDELYEEAIFLIDVDVRCEPDDDSVEGWSAPTWARTIDKAREVAVNAARFLTE